MCPIHWRPEVNPLTVPPSYKIRHVPTGSMDTEGIAAAMAEENPNYTIEETRMMLDTLEKVIRKSLLEGKQTTLDGFVSFGVSFTGRLDDPEDPLPPVEDSLQVNAYILNPFLKLFRQLADPQRDPRSEKLPIIDTAEDTTLGLHDVLEATGALRMTGTNLAFNQASLDEGCTITGTRSGTQKQTRFVTISNSEVTLLPDIPAQDDPWNNEYRITLSTRYTEHGNLRTNIYRNRLRTPLAVPGLGLPTPPETGILTGSAAVPYVGVNGGTVTADERLRIQVVQDLLDERLLFNLIDMHEGGAAGAEVVVTENGEYILPGFAGSAVSTLEITVNDYAALWDMLRSDYNGRLVDILDVAMA